PSFERKMTPLPARAGCQGNASATIPNTSSAIGSSWVIAMKPPGHGCPDAIKPTCDQLPSPSAERYGLKSPFVPNIALPTLARPQAFAAPTGEVGDHAMPSVEASTVSRPA